MSDKPLGDRDIGRMEPDRTRAGEEASHLADTARGTANDLAENARGGLADSAARAGDALHDAARNIGQGDMLGSMIEAAARQMESLSSSLRSSGGGGDITRDITTFARRQPALFLGGAAAAGFALGRMAVAGGQRHSRSSTADVAQGESVRRSTSGATPGSQWATSAESGKDRPGAPTTTTPGQQSPGARPQARGTDAGGLTADE